MRKAFMCSLCHNGIIGGALYLDRQSVTFVCQKLTVDEKYKKLCLLLNDIDEIIWRRVIFPIAVFRMKSGEEYKILIFNKQRFQNLFQEYRIRM